MPYIDQTSRAGLLPLSPRQALNTGELTFQLFYLAFAYVEKAKPQFQNFQRRSEAYAALMCAAAEFYRRHIAPYEDEKIQQNGDVTL